MRVHRNDEPGSDEPDDGWVEASTAAPTSTLADVLQTWTVVRAWHRVKAPSAAEAIEQTRGAVVVGDDGYQVQLDHDDVHAVRTGIAVVLYHTEDELRMMADELGSLFDQQAHLLRQPGHPEAELAASRERLTKLNSLRTQYMEAVESTRRFNSDG